MQKAVDLGAVSSDLAVERILLILRPSSGQQAELTALLAAQHDVRSPYYHKWLKPEEYAAHLLELYAKCLDAVSGKK